MVFNGQIKDSTICYLQVGHRSNAAHPSLAPPRITSRRLSSVFFSGFHRVPSPTFRPGIQGSRAKIKPGIQGSEGPQKKQGSRVPVKKKSYAARGKKKSRDLWFRRALQKNRDPGFRKAKITPTSPQGGKPNYNQFFFWFFRF